jgi:hypothetical protein
MKVVVVFLVLFLLLAAAVWLTPAQPSRLGTPVGCGVLTKDYPSDDCTPRPS